MKSEKYIQAMILGSGHYKTLLCHKLKDWKGSDFLSLPLKEMPFINKIIQYQQRKIEFRLQNITEKEHNYSSVRRQLPNKDGYIFVYSVNDQISFKRLVDFLDEVKEHGECDRAKLLIGLKNSEQRRKITEEDGLLFARQNGMLFEEIALWQSEDYAIKLLEKFSQQIDLNPGWSFSPSSFVNRELKFDRKQYISQIIRLNTCLRDIRLQRMNMKISLHQSKEMPMWKIRNISDVKEKLQATLLPFCKHASQISDIIKAYEMQTLKLRQKLAQIQQKFDDLQRESNEKYAILESICDRIGEFTVNNLAEKISSVNEDYCNYRLKLQRQDHSSFTQSTIDEKDVLSAILNSLNFSFISKKSDNNPQSCNFANHRI